MRSRSRRVSFALGGLYGILAATGLVLLGEALFVPRAPVVYRVPPPETASPLILAHVGREADLAKRRMTRRIAVPPAAPKADRPAPVPLESIIRLAGILDFGGKRPSLAVIEIATANETKAFKAGDAIGDTGAILREIGDGVIVEYGRRLYKVTYAGVREHSANPVGARNPDRQGLREER